MADFALYHVKHNGRDGWAAFRPADPRDIPMLLQALQDDPARVFARPPARVIGSVGALRPAAPSQEA